MKVSMLVDFQILKNKNENYVPISTEEATSISIGGYCFIINGKEIPFDWDAFVGDEENNIFSFETGYGFLFNDFQLSDCYDNCYKELGLEKENITADFLASAEYIEEFHINFIDENEDEIDFGYNEDSELYKIKLLNLKFINIETDDEYYVKQDVLDDYNNRI